MAKLPDKIYIIDPYDEDGDLVDNTEDVLWCQDAVGDENVEYISSQSVADALPSTWYADAPIEHRVKLIVEQWQKLHQREKQVADALAELRTEMEAVIERPYTDKLPDTQLLSKTSARHWQGRLDSTIANLGLESTEHAADCPCAWCRVRRDNAEIGKRS